MRYIYYVVAALIFLAVVNLASRFIGNDTQELLSDLNPDQPAAQAEIEPGPEAVKPPVVGLDANQNDDLTEQLTEDSTSDKTTREPVDASLEAAVTSNQLADSAQSAGTTNVAAVESNVQASATSIDDQAAAPTKLASEVVAKAGDLTRENAAADMETKVGGAAAALVDEPSAVAPNPAKEVTTAVVDAGTPQGTPEATGTELATLPTAATTEPAVVEAIQAEIAESQVNPSVAMTDPATEVPDTGETVDLTESEEPGLIQSLGDSAGSAATAVVGGAQQAVETVVEAARSLIDTEDSVEEKETAATVAETPQAVTPQRIADPAVAVVAAALTDAAQTEKATTPEAVDASTQTPQAQTPQPQIPNTIEDPVQNTAAIVEQPAGAVQATDKSNAAAPPTKPESVSVAPVAEPVLVPTQTKAGAAIAPSQVLALVEQHPGKVLMVGFFSPNCRDCKPSLGWLNEMRRKYWAQGLQVIGVNLGTEAQAESYLEDAPVSFEILHDSTRELAAAFWLAEQPSTYIVAASGKLLSMHQGHSPSRVGEYEDAIRTALATR